MTVLFADVVDSMALAERLGAEGWHHALDRFFRILGASIHRFGGTINQFTGDGVMALFGAPIALEDHAQRACHATLEIRDALTAVDSAFVADYGARFRARIGLNSGDVVVGAIGDDLRMDYTAQGHSVGLAARVERLARPGSACLTANTARLVSGYFELSSLGDHRLHGSQHPVGVYELMGPGALRTRLERAGAGGFSPFVGRDALIASLERAIEESGLAVGIEGAAGVGKSRLAFEFAERCRRRGIRVFSAHCPSHGESVPWLPIQELLRELFGVGDAPDAAARIASDPVFAGPELRDAFPLALELLGLEPPEADTAQRGPISESDRRERIAALLVGLVGDRARNAPSLVLVDDLHWIDAASAGVLESLAESIAGTRALLVVIFRTDFSARWMRAGHYRQIGIGALAPESGQTLVEALIGPDPSTALLRERVLRDSGGNPLFIEELVRALAETGRLAGARGEYRLVETDAAFETPPALQPILAARIDRLPDVDKDVLQMAAVIGRQFERPILVAIAPYAAERVIAALERLEAAQFVRCPKLHPDAAWEFHHGLLRDVAYTAMLQQRREKLHAAVASAIADSSDALGQKASLIAYHWEAAGRRHEARRWRSRAALRVTNIQPRRQP